MIFSNLLFSVHDCEKQMHYSGLENHKIGVSVLYCQHISLLTAITFMWVPETMPVTVISDLFFTDAI